MCGNSASTLKRHTVSAVSWLDLIKQITLHTAEPLECPRFRTCTEMCNLCVECRTLSRMYIYELTFIDAVRIIIIDSANGKELGLVNNNYACKQNAVADNTARLAPVAVSIVPTRRYKVAPRLLSTELQIRWHTAGERCKLLKLNSLRECRILNNSLCAATAFYVLPLILGCRSRPTAAVV